MDNTLQQIQRAQDNYGKMLKLLPELRHNSEVLHQAKNIMQELIDFYENPHWLTLHDNSDQYEFDTHGNYSVLSEDAIWNVLVEYHEIMEELQQENCE